jgi:hypothetical protein
MKKIISEDKWGWPVEGVLSEAATSDVYVTEIASEIYGEELSQKHNEKIKIQWTLEEEHRSWGVKSMMPVVPDQEIEITLVDSSGEEDVELKKTILLKDVEVEFSMPEEPKGSISLAPATLEVDVKRGKATVVFQIA